MSGIALKDSKDLVTLQRTLTEPVNLETLVSLAKRRGFIFQSSEIYGGLGSTWDYGPLGVEMKKNLKDAWWRAIVRERDDIVGIDAAILMHPDVWKASGHVSGFTDPLRECQSCHQRFRADTVQHVRYVEGAMLDFSSASVTRLESVVLLDGLRLRVIDGPFKVKAAFLRQPPTEALTDQLIAARSLRRVAPESEALPVGDYEPLFATAETRRFAFAFDLGTASFQDSENAQIALTCMTTQIEIAFNLKEGQFRVIQPTWPACPDCGGQLSEPRQFNLMFRTFMGPVQDAAHQVWLRPETAQGIFVNFENVRSTSRRKIPFGIAQIGKSFRNEITPGNFIYRTREFEQMEMEYFIRPETADEWFRYWIDFSTDFFTRFGIRRDSLRQREHTDDERPHYARAAVDIEYRFSFGWSELETINNRGDYDLKNHARQSGRDLEYFDDATKERFTPYVIEPAMGADRTMLAMLVDAYDEQQGEKETRTVLHLHPEIAPVTVAVLPLSRNEKLVPTARRVHELLRPHWSTQYDDSQSIGRRYRRQDEVGTPLCVTVDFETVEADDAVTIRDRDTMEQIRVPIENLKPAISARLTEMTRSTGG